MTILHMPDRRVPTDIFDEESMKEADALAAMCFQAWLDYICCAGLHGGMGREAALDLGRCHYPSNLRPLRTMNAK